ncbi:hypothetical protein UF75_0978 [Desulfosporosinus sp. I2]|nr:hypothetical protein [Desulfosporosinus sp. I2]KJR48606.1 hypothetical protein UF75_0978 [Desulfosporosinus sp. I2]
MIFADLIVDAHSLPNIAREYNTFEQVQSSFGDIHRTYCLTCEKGY